MAFSYYYTDQQQEKASNKNYIILTPRNISRIYLTYIYLTVKHTFYYYAI